MVVASAVSVLKGTCVPDDVTRPRIGSPGGFGAMRARAFPRVAAIDWKRSLGRVMFASALIYSAAFAVRVVTRGYYVFLPNYLAQTVGSITSPAVAGPTHVFLLFTDHFEPDYEEGWVAAWLSRYVAMAKMHRDADGRAPQHTFFYPGEQYSRPIYEMLRDTTRAGFGEVELHFHHGYDTADSFRDTLADAIADFRSFGFLETLDGKTAFSFIHGNSGLDNSNGEWLCGINREIDLLHDLGCYADFTFPSLFEDSQPNSANLIYAATDDDRPKSYDRRLPLSSLRDGSGQLMIFEGPLIFAPSLNVRHLFLDLDDGDIHAAEHASPRRADRWIRANVHVAERPDWRFVKLFGHCISSRADVEACLDAEFDKTLAYLEREYNDGRRYVLHYVTAREAYNLARAAAEGATGDPRQYFDAYIKPYKASRRDPARP